MTTSSNRLDSLTLAVIIEMIGECLGQLHVITVSVMGLSSDWFGGMPPNL